MQNGGKWNKKKAKWCQLCGTSWEWVHGGVWTQQMERCLVTAMFLLWTQHANHLVVTVKALHTDRHHTVSQWLHGVFLCVHRCLSLFLKVMPPPTYILRFWVFVLNSFSHTLDYMTAKPSAPVCMFVSFICMRAVKESGIKIDEQEIRIVRVSGSMRAVSC